MIFDVYALKDEKVGFKQPFYSLNLKEVLVSFTRLVNDPKCPFPAEDTNLYKIGTFNDETGELLPLDDGCLYPIAYGKRVLEKKEEVHGEQN